MKHPAGVTLVLAIAAACSGGQKPTNGTTGGGGGGGGGTGGGTGSAVVAEGPITQAECEQMVDHILAIGVEDAKKTTPEAEWPKPDEIAQAKAAMVADKDWMAQCLAFARPQFTCLMAAGTQDALMKCASE
jgi:hypothetical protein